MRQIGMLVLALVITVAFTTSRSVSDEPKKGEVKVENQLVGTWKVVSAKFDGTDAKPPEGTTQLKHVTPAQFMWAIHDKDGNVTTVLGGTYSLKGDSYVETPEYGTSDILPSLKGKPQTFKWKVEGNKWYHAGKLSTGQTIEEVWQRVEKK
jgi:hypothetical protein